MLDSAALADLIAELVGDHVERATAPLIARIVEIEQRAAPGPDAAAINEAVATAVAALPAPQDGKSVTLEDVAPLIDQAVTSAVEALPPPAAGKDADTVAMEKMVRGLFVEAVAALPVPKDGLSVTPDDVAPLVRSAVEAAMAEIPRPKDGESVDIDVVRSLIAEEVGRLPTAKDGVGLADALIDRDGGLAITLTDGSIRSLGRVVGTDGFTPPGIKDAKITGDHLILTFTDGSERDLGEVRGKPGFGLDQFDVTQGEDGRTIELSFSEADVVHRFELEFPVLIYRDVYLEGREYAEGDVVTWGGSLWIAQKATSSKPDTAESGWRLAVKRGRDARPSKQA